MSRLFCPECGQRVKKCSWGGWGFLENDPIICIGIRGKHFTSEEYLEFWLKEKFEKHHQIVHTCVMWEA